MPRPLHLNLFLPAARRPGAAGRLAARLAPGWAYSPVRRLVQAAALAAVLYLLLFPVRPGGDGRAFGAERILALDPLASISAALAARTWVWSLAWAGAILAACLVVPRGFCGYLCPLGALIDLFDWLVGRRARRLHVRRRGWWVLLRYYVLTAVLLAAVAGVTVTGFVAAIPVLIRGLASVAGLPGGWSAGPPVTAGQVLSVALLAAAAGLGLLGPRFWCRCLCPTGAVFSIGTLLRLAGRKVSAECVRCGQCAKACDFDAVRPDFATRSEECTFCQACGGACPAGAITFTTGRKNAPPPAPVGAGETPAVPAGEDQSRTSLSRRGFLAAAAGGAAAVLAAGKAFGARLPWARSAAPVRPPGSVPEEQFLALCVRCGSCMKACPTGAIQPTGLDGRIEGMWTPHLHADWGACDPKCNLCGQACPTGAIRSLPLTEKQAARCGLAVIDERTCLPHAGAGDCGECVLVCRDAGHDAMDFLRLDVQTGDDGPPVPGSGLLAPVVLPDKCVGCGACQRACYQHNVRQKHLLKVSAVRVLAGPGREDRLARGSYRALREAQARQREAERQKHLKKTGGSDDYLPDFLK